MKAIIITIAATLLGAFTLLQAGSGLLFSNEEQPFSTAEFLRAARNKTEISRPPNEVQPTPKPYEMITDLCQPHRWEPTPLAKFNGRVSHIQDGDTLTARVQGENITIRLWGIDAPELSQPQGTASKLALSRLAMQDTQITIHAMGADKYGRTLAVVQAENGNIAVNADLVLNGNAYHYNLYEAKANRCLAKMQSQARNYPLGLWREYGPEGGTRPWKYRRATSATEPLNNQGPQRALEQRTKPEPTAKPTTKPTPAPTREPEPERPDSSENPANEKRFPPLKPPPTVQPAPQKEQNTIPKTPAPPRITPHKSYPQQNL